MMERKSGSFTGGGQIHVCREGEALAEPRPEEETSAASTTAGVGAQSTHAIQRTRWPARRAPAALRSVSHGILQQRWSLRAHTSTDARIPSHPSEIEYDLEMGDFFSS